MTLTDEGDFIGTTTLYTSAYGNNKLFVGGVGIFGVFNEATNITSDLSGTDDGWLDGLTISSLAYDSVNNGVYIATLETVGGNQGFGYYDIDLNTTTDLSMYPVNGTTLSHKIIYNPNDNAVLISIKSDSSPQDNHLLYYDDASFIDVLPNDDTLTETSESFSGFNDIDYDPATNIAFLTGSDGDAIPFNLATLNASTNYDQVHGYTSLSKSVIAHDSSGSFFSGADSFAYFFEPSNEYSCDTYCTNNPFGLPPITGGFSEDGLTEDALILQSSRILFVGSAVIPGSYYRMDLFYEETPLINIDDNDFLTGANIISFTASPSNRVFMVGTNGVIGKYTPLVESLEFDFLNVLLGIILLFTGVAIMIYMMKGLSGAK